MRSSAGIVIVLAAVTLLSISTATQADAPSLRVGEYVYRPTPGDLYDLNHYKYYTWGFEKTWGDDEIVVFVKLTIKKIRNWKVEPNDLYIHLLDDAPLGVTTHTDNQGGGDNFLGQGPLLVHYEDLPVTAQTLEYEFTPRQVAQFNAFAADGVVATGWDPDCHYWNKGVKLQVRTEIIPEPATMGLLSLGALPLLKRFRRRKKA